LGNAISGESCLNYSPRSINSDGKFALSPETSLKIREDQERGCEPVRFGFEIWQEERIIMQAHAQFDKVNP